MSTEPEAILLGVDLAFEVDTTIYELDAVLRVAYQFTDRCYLFIARDEKDPRRLTVYMGAKSADADPAALAGDFSNALIDQQLRAVLAREAGPLRELIVAQAFAEGNLLDPQRDEGDYREDPHGIG